jgi:hypothetical protein
LGRPTADARGPLEQQVEQRAAERIGQRPQLLGRGDHDHLVEVVVRDLLDRHERTILGFWNVPIFWIIRFR